MTKLKPGSLKASSELHNFVYFPLHGSVFSHVSFLYGVWILDTQQKYLHCRPAWEWKNIGGFPSYSTFPLPKVLRGTIGRSNFIALSLSNQVNGQLGWRALLMVLRSPWALLWINKGIVYRFQKIQGTQNCTAFKLFQEWVLGEWTFRVNNGSVREAGVRHAESLVWSLEALRGTELVQTGMTWA